jgi:hypothetical protein
MSLTPDADVSSWELVSISVHPNKSTPELCNDHKWSSSQSNELTQQGSTLCPKRKVTTAGRSKNDKRKRLFLRSKPVLTDLRSKQENLDQKSDQPEQLKRSERF